MAIYRKGKAGMASNGVVTGNGTTWMDRLSLIRVGATILFPAVPGAIATISAIVSDTELRVIANDNKEAPAGSDYVILIHDSITVDGLAQDVAETLKYYQSKETVAQNLIDEFNNEKGSFAKKGDNTDITSIRGLTTALGVEYGGTGGNTPAKARTQLGCPAGVDAQMCTAWAMFSGSAPGSPRGGFNISSVSILDAGIYQVNFASQMANTNYSVSISFDPDSDAVAFFNIEAAPRVVYVPNSQRTINGFRIYSGVNSPTQSLRLNMRFFNISVFGGK